MYHKERYGISPHPVANVVGCAIDLPEDTNVNEFTIGPTEQAVVRSILTKFGMTNR